MERRAIALVDVAERDGGAAARPPRAVAALLGAGGQGQGLAAAPVLAVRRTEQRLDGRPRVAEPARARLAGRRRERAAAAMQADPGFAQPYRVPMALEPAPDLLRESAVSSVGRAPFGDLGLSSRLRTEIRFGWPLRGFERCLGRWYVRFWCPPCSAAPRSCC